MGCFLTHSDQRQNPFVRRCPSDITSQLGEQTEAPSIAHLCCASSALYRTLLRTGCRELGLNRPPLLGTEEGFQD